MKKFRFVFLFILVGLILAGGFWFYKIYNQYLIIKDSVASRKDLNEVLAQTQKLDQIIGPAKIIFKFNKNLDKKYQILHQIIESKESFIDLLGFNGEKNFLIVFQNNTEMRPSGGFWGAYGVLKIKDGQIISLTTNNSYFVDPQNKGRFTPPTELAEYFQDEWRFYNANWSPDFQKAAEQGLFFYNQAYPQVKFDGVLGPNVDYLLALLKISGPIQTPGHDFQIDENNFLLKMIYEPVDPAVYETKKDDPGFITDANDKKTLLGPLAQKIITEALAQKSRDFYLATLDALENQNLLIYTKDTKLEATLDQLGWTGKTPENQNFAEIVDTNLGSKLDFLIDKHATIKKTGANQYELTVTYRNTLDLTKDRQNQAFVIYRDLIRVFLPENAEFISATGGQQKVEIKFDSETQKNYLNNLIILSPGQEETITFSWRVPEDLGKIKLYKQPGSHIKLDYE